jgi:hypothetical protein
VNKDASNQDGRKLESILSLRTQGRRVPDFDALKKDDIRRLERRNKGRQRLIEMEQIIQRLIEVERQNGGTLRGMGARKTAARQFGVSVWTIDNLIMDDYSQYPIRARLIPRTLRDEKGHPKRCDFNAADVGITFASALYYSGRCTDTLYNDHGSQLIKLEDFLRDLSEENQAAARMAKSISGRPRGRGKIENLLKKFDELLCVAFSKIWRALQELDYTRSTGHRAYRSGKPRSWYSEDHALSLVYDFVHKLDDELQPQAYVLLNGEYLDSRALRYLLELCSPLHRGLPNVARRGLIICASVEPAAAADTKFGKMLHEIKELRAVWPNRLEIKQMDADEFVPVMLTFLRRNLNTVFAGEFDDADQNAVLQEAAAWTQADWRLIATQLVPLRDSRKIKHPSVWHAKPQSRQDRNPLRLCGFA